MRKEGRRQGKKERKKGSNGREGGVRKQGGVEGKREKK